MRHQPTAPLVDDSRFLMLVIDVGQEGDVDNKIKYTLDALVGPILGSDENVRQVFGAAHDVAQVLDVADPTPVLAEVLQHVADGQPLPICYLRITAPPLTTEELLDV